MRKLVLTVCVCVAWFGCDLTQNDSQQLSSDDINGISAALTNAMNAGMSSLHRRQPETAINGSYACPAGGHITMVGNFYVNAQAGTFSAQWTFNVGDRGNNLNDCDVGGVIIDGSIYFSMSGGQTSWSATMDGSLTVNRRGPSGGLIPITDACGIFLTFRM